MQYQKLLSEIGRISEGCGRSAEEITLVAVSKGHAWSEAQNIYERGCRDFGENRLAEALEKKEKAPQDVRWHFIGTLQRNKVRKAVGEFALIHSVDSIELAEKISLCSKEAGVVTRILLQANTSGEATKQGLTPEEWKRGFEKVIQWPGIRVEGLMTMAPFVEDETIVRRCFARLRELRDALSVEHLSMGMSHDYPIAIQEGATILRIGTVLFG